MGDLAWAGKLAADFGVMAVLMVGLVLTYRLTDKWAEKFLAAQQDLAKAMAGQAGAMTALAAAVKEGQGDQKAILMALTLLAERIDTQREYLIRLEKISRPGEGD